MGDDARAAPSVDLGVRTVQRERHAFQPLGLAIAIGAVAASCGLAALVHPALGTLVYVLPAMALYRWTRADARDASLRMEGDALVIDAQGAATRVPRSRITGAYLTLRETAAAGATPSVMVTLRDRTLITLSATSVDDARQVIRALGFDPSQRRAEFRGVRIFHRLLAVLLGPTAGVALVAYLLATFRDARWLHTPAVALALWALATFAVVRAVLPRLDVTVGRDGVHVGGALRRRFIPWSAVEYVSQGPGELVIRRRHGRAVRAWCNVDDPRVLAALYARARDALDAYRAAEGTADPIVALDRNGRSLAAWREALGGLLGPVQDYRSATIDRARLEAVLADPATTAERRIAAAIALSQSAEARGRARVRVAAEVSADPVEREALARIAEGAADDATVEAALQARKG